MKNTPTPPRGDNIPGSNAEARLKGARISKPVVIDHSFVADPRGGPELRAPHGIEVRDNRTHSKL
jgi:hypothetical protein